MAITQKRVSIKRSTSDRRSPIDRRVPDIGRQYPCDDRREGRIDRRKGWEDRYGWERISKWTSAPISKEKSWLIAELNIQKAYKTLKYSTIF
jgi:hypothetical protein